MSLSDPSHLVRPTSRRDRKFRLVHECVNVESRAARDRGGFRSRGRAQTVAVAAGASATRLYANALSQRWPEACALTPFTHARTVDRRRRSREDGAMAALGL
jgi:hypothetical protein